MAQENEKKKLTWAEQQSVLKKYMEAHRKIKRNNYTVLKAQEHRAKRAKHDWEKEFGGKKVEEVIKKYGNIKKAEEAFKRMMKEKEVHESHKMRIRMAEGTKRKA